MTNEHPEYGMDGRPTGRVVRVLSMDEAGKCELEEAGCLSQDEMDGLPVCRSNGTVISTHGEWRRSK